MKPAAASLEDLYDALDNDAPLDIDRVEDQRLYVADLHKTEGPSPVEELIFQIKRNKTPGAWYFTGHRGVGKSTELRRVAHEILAAGHGAVVADMGEYVNLAEEISIELLLLTMMAAYMLLFVTLWLMRIRTMIVERRARALMQGDA